MKLFLVSIYGFFVVQLRGLPLFFPISLFILTKQIIFREFYVSKYIFFFLLPFTYILILSVFLLVFSNQQYNYNFFSEAIIILVLIVSSLVISSEIQNKKRSFSKLVNFIFYFIIFTAILDFVCYLSTGNILISYFEPLEIFQKRDSIPIFGVSNSKRIQGLCSEPSRLMLVTNIIFMIKNLIQEEKSKQNNSFNIFSLLFIQFGTLSITGIPLTLINLFFVFRNSQFTSLLLYTLISIFFFIFLFFSGDIYNLINSAFSKLSGQHVSGSGRYFNFVESISMAYNSYFLGSGIDSYVIKYGRNTGNMFTLILLEGGFLPFILYILAIFYSIKQILTHSYFNNSVINYLLLAIFFLITQSFQSEPYNILLFLHIIYGLSLTKRVQI